MLLNPARDEIVDTLADLRRRLRENTALLLYYAGHDWLGRAIKAKNVLVAADSYVSGRLVRGLTVKLDAPGHYDRMSNMRTRVVITSGGCEPVVDDNGTGHSPFAPS